MNKPILFLACMLAASISISCGKPAAPCELSCGRPDVLVEGSDSLMTSAYDLAVKTVIGNIKRSGIITAGREYGGEWTRDIAINTRNACNIICPEEAVYSLWKVTDDETQTIGHQYWDKIIWVPAAYEQYLVTGDEVLLEKAYRFSVNTFNDLKDKYYDGSGLFRGASVFNDGISAYEEPVYDPANESGNVLDYPSTYLIKCLSTNCIYYEALRTLAKMAAHFHDDPGVYTEMASSLKASILNYFLDGQSHTLAYLIDQNGDAHHFQEALGYAFAILFDVVEGEEAAAVVSHAHVGRYGIPSIWPDFKRFSAECPGRHNNLIWPHVNAFFAEAALKAGNKDAFMYELRNMAALAMSVPGGNFYEIYNPETGIPDGGWQKGGNLNSSSGQTWCATGFLSMIYRGVFGIRYTEDGLVVRPDKDIMDAAGLTLLDGLKYRNASVSVRKGKSLLRGGVYLNGHKCKDQAVIPTGFIGEAEVVIY